jgi:methionine synthase II (cobalamin-independent)
MTMRSEPPFRADHVGSILRSAPIKQARERCAEGHITAADLKAIENREIETIIRKQESIGLNAVTDGEYRRAWWHFDFYGFLEGVELREVSSGIPGACRPKLKLRTSWESSAFRTPTRCSTISAS